MTGAPRAFRTMIAVLALAFLAAGARAATSGTPAKATVVLRGPQKVDAPAPPPAPPPPSSDPGIGPPPLMDLSPIPRFQDDPVPRFGGDPAPRVGGLDLIGGGAQCRTACAQSRYQCRVTEDADQCDSAWGQCVASCTEASPGRL